MVFWVYRFKGNHVVHLTLFTEVLRFVYGAGAVCRTCYGQYGQHTDNNATDNTDLTRTIAGYSNNTRPWRE